MQNKNLLPSAFCPLPSLDAATDNPNFKWEKQTRRYRNKQTGRFVSKEAVYTLTVSRIELAKTDLDTLGQLLLDNKISLKSWQQQTAESLKILHTQQYLLGVGGQKDLLGVGGQKAIQKSDYLEIARELKNQYQYLRNFAIDLTQGKMTEAQFKARSGMYADAAKVSYFRGEKVAAARAGFTHARRILGLAEHCIDCPQIAALGIVSIKDVIFPTQQCSCRIRCKCRLEFLNPEEAIA
ncbi:hypothetical protein H6G36_29565 [Anabaena minutissima FACHB-250]|nr:hypothetical protein [Anabaena minutissima FACHB-250]